MEITFEPMDQRTLIMLLRTGRPQHIHAYARKNGWRLILKNSKSNRILADADTGDKIFLSLSDLKAYLYDIAVPSFLVDTSALDPLADDVETQARLGEARQAAAYDEWLNAQVQESLDDPAPSISSAVVKERSAARRAIVPRSVVYEL